jgi:hypothetical protein
MRRRCWAAGGETAAGGVAMVGLRAAGRRWRCGVGRRGLRLARTAMRGGLRRGLRLAAWRCAADCGDGRAEAAARVEGWLARFVAFVPWAAYLA